MSETEHGAESQDSPEARRADYERQQTALDAAHARLRELEEAMRQPGQDPTREEAGRQLLEFLEAVQEMHHRERAVQIAVREMRMNGEWTEADTENYFHR